MIYEVDWRISPPPKTSPISGADQQGAWLILADQGGIGEGLAERLLSLGQKSVTVTSGRKYDRSGETHITLCPSRPDDFSALLADAFAAGGPACRGVIHLWGVDSTPPDRTTPESLRADLELGCASLLYLVQALEEAEGTGRPHLWIATRGAQPVDGDGVPNPSQGSLWGFGRTIAAERPGLWGGLIDLDPAREGRDSAGLLLDAVLAGDREDQIAWRRGERYVARLVQQPEPWNGRGTPWKSDGSYLLTGGLGGLGLQVAARMVEGGARDLVLLQRSNLPARSTWANVKQGSHLASQIAAIQALESKGARVHVFAADVAREDQVESVLREIRESLPPLRGIIHAAGIADLGILSQLSQDRFEQVMAPKVTGAWNLHRLTLSASLDFFVCFSSISSVLGSAGQANYASANAGMDALVHYRRGLGLPALSINWGPWSEVGMAAGHADRVEGWYGSIAPRQAVRLLEALIQQRRPQLAVVGLDGQRMKESMVGARNLFLSELSSRSTQFVATPDVGRVESREVKPPLRKVIVGSDQAARGRLLQDYLTEEMSKILQLAPSELNMNRPLNSLGIDSLMALELRNRIESDLPVRVQISNLLEGWSADDLLRNLLTQVQSEPAGKSADRVARVKQEVDQMSDEAVRALLEVKRHELNRRRSSQ